MYGAEINNIRTFLAGFFDYRSLDEWRTILDDVLFCAQKTTIFNSGHERCEIFFVKEYLEKMVEALFLVFNTTSLPYAKLHHASDFSFKSEDEMVGG